MILIHQLPGRLLFVAVALAGCASVRVARAQNDHEPEENAVADPAAVRQLAVVEARRLAILQNQAVDQQLKRHQLNASLDALLSRRLDELKSSCRLSEAQLKKLTVAGHGDIKRLMDEWDANARVAQRAMMGRRVVVKLAIGGADTGDDASEDSFGEGSLFSKTARTALDREQAQRYEQALAGQRRERYEWALLQGANSIRANLDLSAGQAEALVDLIVRETPPPKRYGRAPDFHLFLFQVARLPEATVRPLLNDSERRRLSRWTAPFKESAGGAEMLRREGFIFDDTSLERKSVPGNEPKPKKPEG
jgi:hypothetical protein